MYAEVCLCFEEAKECIALDHTVNQVSNVECKKKSVIFHPTPMYSFFHAEFLCLTFSFILVAEGFFSVRLLQRTYTQKSHISAINFIQFHAPFSTKWLEYCIRSSDPENQRKTEIRNMISTYHM